MITAPTMAMPAFNSSFRIVGTNVPNLFAPIAGGLVCDLLFIAHQRLAMRRLFEDVFLLDEKAAREYFLEEPEFAAVVEFFEYRDRQGDGWQILVDCWRGDGSAEDALARAEAAGERLRRLRTLLTHGFEVDAVACKREGGVVVAAHPDGGGTAGLVCV